MCGISGIISKDDKINNNLVIKKMTDLIEHRGPDDSGYYTSDNVFFGHRRLSIIDLSDHGHQPMFYNNNEFVLTYNGEIYNYLELRDELKEKGYIFETDSDSEVILASYAYWGQDCVNHFNGMWAFAIHDKKKNLILMSRDRFGIKPFYYMDINSGFYFGSEIKQFTILKNNELKLNTKIALRFLVYGELNTTDETFIDNVFELKGGYKAIYDLKKKTLKKEKWYDINNIEEQANITQEDAEKKFSKYFKDSVQLRLRSDVKLGALLSGGLDSSAIVSIVDEIIGDSRFDTISSCFHDKKYDEQEYIDEVIKEKNITPHKIFPNLSDLFSIDMLDKIVWYQDQPISSSSHFAEYLVFESAKENKLKVVLDGQGSDEILGGYHEFFPVYLFELLTKYKFITFLNEMKFINKIHGYGYKEIIKKLFLYIVPNSSEVLIRKFFKKSLLPPWILQNDENIQYLQNNKLSTSNLIKYSIHQLLVRSVPYQLHSEDRNSMVHSVESRLPFLDYKLVEFIISLPSEFKIFNGTTKFILRESLQNVLPTKIKNRQNKMGFVTPEETWMKENSDLVKRELISASEYTNGMIQKNIIDDFEKMLSGEKKFSRHYFRIISFYRWLKVFNIKV